MNNEYFTPSIEDIRVGYEYEEAVLDYSCHGCKPEAWTKVVFGKDLDLDLRTGNLPKLPHPVFMRVPYLTASQIEAEGWDFKAPSNDSILVWGIIGIFTKKKEENIEYKITYTDNHYLMINLIIHKVNGEKESMSLYNGECKDINTFRFILKLLNIC